MINTLLLILFFAFVGCSNMEGRKIADIKPEPHSILGKWEGMATISLYGEEENPLVCGKMVAEIRNTGINCNYLSEVGRLMDVQLECIDDLLSKKGQIFYSQNTRLCETITKLEIPEAGKSWITLVGPEDKFSKSKKDHQGAFVMDDTSIYVLKDLGNAIKPKLIRFTYINRISVDNELQQFRATFSRPIVQ